MNFQSLKEEVLSRLTSELSLNEPRREPNVMEGKCAPPSRRNPLSEAPRISAAQMNHKSQFLWET